MRIVGHDPKVEDLPAPRSSYERREPTNDDVRAKFRRLRATGDPSLREQLIIDHRWIATQCARRFRYRGEPELDLVQAALLGLVKATDRFDPERDVPFHAFAIPTILGELKRHFRDTTWSVGVPRSAKDLMPRLRQATECLDQRLGRSPTTDELAAELRVDREVVIAALAARGANRPMSLSEPTSDIDRGIEAARSHRRHRGSAGRDRSAGAPRRAQPQDHGVALLRRTLPTRDRRASRHRPGSGVAPFSAAPSSVSGTNRPDCRIEVGAFVRRHRDREPGCHEHSRARAVPRTRSTASRLSVQKDDGRSHELS